MKTRGFTILILSVIFVLTSTSAAYAGNFKKALINSHTVKTDYKILKNGQHSGSKSKNIKIRVKVSGPKQEKPKKHIPVTQITLNKSSINLNVGSWERLVAIVKPDNADNKHVLWASGNPEVAVVNPSGKVSGIRPGTAVIYAIAPNGYKTASCNVTVTTGSPAPTPVPVTGIYLNKTKITLKAGSTTRLTATVKPNNATDKSVNWVSSNTAVATVDSSGNVTGVAKGTAIITVTTSDVGKYDTCLIEVTTDSKRVAVTQVKLNLVNTMIPVGFKENLRYQVEPLNATDQEVNWRSSNPAVASVNDIGVIEGKSTGSAVITVTTVDGRKKATCSVTVAPPVELPSNGILLNKVMSTVLVGATDYPVVTIYPAGTSVQSLDWSSSNSSVATVSQTGVVTGVAPGTAVITVKTSDNKTASYLLIVTVS